MTAESDALRQVRVSDVMNRHVVSISANDRMGHAAQQLLENDVTGAPIIDEAGRCVGVLSASDFTRREQDRDVHGQTASDHCQEVLVQDFPGGAYHVEEIVDDRVGNHMTTAVQTIAPSATLLQAARCMCLEHVHRLIVVDEEQRPVGVLSTLDVLAAMIATMDG